MADQTGITNLLTSGKAVQAGQKGMAKGKQQGEAQAEEQFSALLAHGPKTKAGMAKDEPEPTAQVARQDESKKHAGADKDGKEADLAPLAEIVDDAARKAEPDVTPNSHRPVVSPDMQAATVESGKDGATQDGLGDVLALLAGKTNAKEVGVEAEVEDAPALGDHPRHPVADRHASHEQKSVHATREAEAKADGEMVADRKVPTNEVKADNASDPVTAMAPNTRTDATPTPQQTAQDNRLPLQMAAVLGFGSQKQALAETRDDAIIIRATRADGKGVAETRKLGGERVETDPAERLQSQRGMPGQTEQKTIDLLSPDKDIKPVMAKSAKADNADMAAARLVDVQVLEARRFVGLADASNASRLGQAIGDDISAIRSTADVPGLNELAGNVTSVVHTLKLQMNPDNLGPMTASLRLKGEELSVDVRVETVEAYRQLTADQDNLVKSLKDQGFAVEQVNIQLAPSASTDSGANAGSQQNPNFGHAGRDQSLTGQGQQGQMPGQGRGNQSGQEQGRQDARNPIIDATETARAPAAASGQLYL